MEIKVGMSVTTKCSPWAWEVIAIEGKSAMLRQGTETKKKRLSAVTPVKKREAYWGEQDLAAATFNHGDTVFSVLAKDGESGRMLWDSAKGEAVPANELTKI